MNRKDEIGEMAATMDQFSDDLQNQVIGTMKKIADGDLSTDVKVVDAQDEIGPALRTTTESLRALVAEANMLSKAAVEGRLATRGNADKFKGGYRDIVAGVNQTLDSVVGPVNEAMRVSNEYATGNFTARVDEKLNVQGDFIKFKEALNNIGIEVSKSLSVINQQVGDLAASAEEANASVEEVSAGSAQVAKNASGVSVQCRESNAGCRTGPEGHGRSLPHHPGCCHQIRARGKDRAGHDQLQQGRHGTCPEDREGYAGHHQVLQ